MKKSLLKLFVLFLVPFVLCAQKIKDGSYARSIEHSELESYINFRFDNDRYSGVTAIFQDSIMEFSATKGKANRDWHVNNTIDTKFDLASATKMFTAIGIAILYDQGKIDLEAPFMTYFTDFPLKSADQITIRQLLSHTSGLSDFFFEEVYLTSDRTRLRTLSNYDRYFTSLRTGEVPENRIAYSNTNFVVLGRIIEIITGIDYYDFIREQIFLPLGMHNTDFFEKDEIVEKRAVGYFNDAQASMEFGVPNDDKTRSNIAIRSIKGMPAGGAFSTVSDINRFMNGIRSGKVISKETYQLFTAELHGGYGLGFQTYEQAGQRVVGHSGGFYGVSTMVFYMPKLNETFISLTNTDFAAQPIFDRYLALLNGEKPFSPISLTSEDLAQYQGYYEVTKGEMTGRQIAVQALENKLLFDSALEFYPYDKDSFFDIDNDQFSLIFQRDQTGEIIGFERGDNRMFTQNAQRIDSSMVKKIQAISIPNDLLQEYAIDLVFTENGMMAGHRPSISINGGAVLIDNMMKFLPYEKDQFFLHDDQGMKLHFTRNADGKINGAEVYREKEMVGKLVPFGK